MTWRIKFIGTGLFKEPPLPLSERNDCNVFSNDLIEWFLLDGYREIMIKSLRLWIKEISLINLIKKRKVCLCKVCLQTSIHFHCPRKFFVNKSAHISEDHLFSFWHSWTFYFWHPEFINYWDAGTPAWHSSIKSTLDWNQKSTTDILPSLPPVHLQSWLLIAITN